MMSHQQARVDASADRSAPPPTPSNDEPVAPESRASSDDSLFELQLAFNLFPAQYVHPSWIAHLGLSAPDPRQTTPLQAAPSPFWVRRLSQALLQARGLDRQFDFDFSHHEKRLALLDATTLLRVSGLVAAVLVRDRVRRIVRGAEVEAVHRAMGVQAHRFALSWNGPLPPLSRHVCDVTGPWPDVEGWSLRSVILAASAIPKNAAGVLGRMQFRFPQRWAQSRHHRLRLNEIERTALAALFFNVIKDTCREWTWLFAPAAPAQEAPC